ncbi:hypothetical protein HPP92_007225 [Vanilla planifolia]|uniref:Terpene synthase metal-binding domain-containing protein n=1 Tax=Vanilla planifolia TaxID=51239 RepID=A0A835RQS4_VANPL|nr:hypothetical protein HPP92_007225 [Vanilla planifolia]
MKLCLQTLHDITNEIANLVLSEHGWNPIDALRTSWASLCKAFLIEAGWFREGITPKTSEYLENGLKSTGVSVILTHFCLLLGNTAGRQITTVPTDGAVLFRLAALSLRLWDDLGSAQDEKQDGFDGSYVYYYMKEHEVSLESAIKHTMEMISDAWKSLNKECLLSNHFSQIVKKAILNSVRMMRVMYTYKNQRLPMLEQYTQLIFLEPI